MAAESNATELTYSCYNLEASSINVETFQHAGKLAAAACPEAEGGPAQP
jgi:hypothetical protein